ncbi:MAG TPA: 3'(2'),5'-bisphosphate nucleotidase CysQ, partial [Geminicoccaceae bacterium]|jgi:3'(2'), 5'-bisphosphate nucleotidase|nr:3'(2'),5'-bisphosphate nucleotidase CysQ [Geminicoccaceae bacterium]
MPDLDRLLPEIVALADRAGRVILEHYHSAVAVRAKADASPVTAADEAAEAVILARLAELTPDIPVVAEETVASGHVPDVDDRPFWLVDPLDGTKEFLSRNGEFTVNIALIEDRLPILGVVLAPARARAWWGARGKGASARDGEGNTRAIAVRQAPAGGLVAIASRSHRDAETQAFLDQAGVAECISAGSSLKFCLVAEGQADLYPRFGRTMEWDVAAGHAVLSAAGGRVTTKDGAPFLYRKPGFENPPFIARGA